MFNFGKSRLCNFMKQWASYSPLRGRCAQLNGACWQWEPRASPYGRRCGQCPPKEQEPWLRDFLPLDPVARLTQMLSVPPHQTFDSSDSAGCSMSAWCTEGRSLLCQGEIPDLATVILHWKLTNLPSAFISVLGSLAGTRLALDLPLICRQNAVTEPASWGPALGPGKFLRAWFLPDRLLGSSSCLHFPRNDLGTSIFCVTVSLYFDLMSLLSTIVPLFSWVSMKL